MKRCSTLANRSNHLKRLRSRRLQLKHITHSQRARRLVYFMQNNPNT